jgi:hypothetical protein
MTCHHSVNDPNCSSHPYNVAQREAEAARETERQRKATTPDSSNYEILDIVEVGTFLVLKVRYPNCSACAFEGTKVLVVKGIMKDAVMWRKIDPHFRDMSKSLLPLSGNRESPSPEARFPATIEGWNDALVYAKAKKVST